PAVDRLAPAPRQAPLAARAEPPSGGGDVAPFPAQKRSALTGADERGRASVGLSEAARPFGADREPSARSYAGKSNRRTGPEPGDVRGFRGGAGCGSARRCSIDAL